MYDRKKSQVYIDPLVLRVLIGWMNPSHGDIYIPHDGILFINIVFDYFNKYLLRFV